MHRPHATPRGPHWSPWSRPRARSRSRGRSRADRGTARMLAGSRARGPVDGSVLAVPPRGWPRAGSRSPRARRAPTCRSRSRRSGRPPRPPCGSRARARPRPGPQPRAGRGSARRCTAPLRSSRSCGMAPRRERSAGRSTPRARAVRGGDGRVEGESGHERQDSRLPWMGRGRRARRDDGLEPSPLAGESPQGGTGCRSV